jgi:hypothetical protein
MPYELRYLSGRNGVRSICGIPPLNYGREDHVRALFNFASGMPLEPRY